MRYAWVDEKKPFIVGQHTDNVCSRLDEAMDDYRAGKSTFLMITIPPRHGKSDMVSRYLPPHFLGEFPDRDTLLTSYSDDKAHEFSRAARDIVKSEKYQRLYPGVYLAGDKQTEKEWDIQRKGSSSRGKAQWAGIGASVTGKGGALIVTDDYIKGREQAESETWRERVWQTWINDVFTRRDPVAIVIILVTRWHKDDIVGRIKEKMKTDPDFPQFEEINYPYRDKSYLGYYLFPERFSPEYYKSMVAALGPYNAAALMEGDPQVKGGNLFRIDKINYINGSRWQSMTKDLQFVRGWDLASGKKERAKDDPDFTAGVKMAVRWIPSRIRGVAFAQIFIDDVILGQWEGMQRNKIIQNAAIADGNINIGIEAFAGYKDAYTEISTILEGIRIVDKCNLPGDKFAKATPLQPVFEAGNVFFKKAPWNAKISTALSEHPNGKHDDVGDAFAVAFSLFSKSSEVSFTR
ncbi:MAG: terminase family protein [Candidatus Auribacterota bacterium]|nr:terminase family protein [Candidatus Auribacterota bacterium]